MAILCHHVATVCQLGFLSVALARQPRIRIARGLMGFVASFLPAKVHRRIARVVLAVSFRLLHFFRPEALLARPRFHQRPVDREVVLADQIPCSRLIHRLVEKLPRHFSVDEPLRFLVKTVTSHTASSLPNPTNHRYNRLYSNSSSNRRSLRMLNNTITNSARSCCSGGIDGRPSGAYSFAKSWSIAASASSVIFRIGRSGCPPGIRSSRHPYKNKLSCDSSLPRILLRRIEQL